MNNRQAINLATECIDKEIQRLAFDANLFEIYKAPHGEKASIKRKRLRQAKEILTNSTLVTQETFTFSEEEKE